MLNNIFVVLVMFFACFNCLELYAEEAATAEVAKAESKEVPEEKTVETHHKVTINGVEIAYKAVAGTANLKDEKGKVTGSLFYVAYTKEGVDKPSERPITFCFNGGPGSASVWLHIGVLGPKRVQTNGKGAIYQPYRSIDNSFSILDKTDLVFIDPMTTGYSRPSKDKENKEFHNYKQDISHVADFIQLFVTRNNRWESPKLLAGESYGTVRAVGLAHSLMDNYYMPMNGIILVSSVLDYGLRDRESDMYYPLILPTYTSVAGFHQKLAPELLKDMPATIKEAEKFASGEYLLALMKGDAISDEERKRVTEKLSRYTGLSTAYLDKSYMRVEQMRFCKQLLADTNQQVGRFDGRIAGNDLDPVNDCQEYDPSMVAIDGGFTAVFNQYVRNNLKWESDDRYVITNHSSAIWDYGDIQPFAFNMVPTLRDLMIETHHLNIFVASGTQDLATPFFDTHYTFNHLQLNPKLLERVHLHDYEGGHMMYLYEPVLKELKRDLDKFIDQTVNFEK
jgi:carboxypeptidase C (cathepsin A)